MTDLGVSATVGVRSSTNGECIVPGSKRIFHKKLTVPCRLYFPAVLLQQSEHQKRLDAYVQLHRFELL
jgi:hypothetical protein